MKDSFFPNIKSPYDNSKIKYGISTRGDGDMRNPESLKSFCYKNHIDTETLILMDQVHSKTYRFIDDTFDCADHPDFPLFIPHTDALICSKKVITLGILTADCLPVLLIDQRQHIIASIHAGRKGIESGILQRIIDKLRKTCKCNKLKALIGPSIGPCCYPVDLWKTVETIFHENVINNVYNKYICTSCKNDIFFSYRKEKDRAGRMLSFIQMTP